jgi:membrane protease YdiL (CAAX protease family)
VALAHLLTNNLCEEVAWMGVVQLRLQQRTTPSRAVLITAPLVALQHLALVADNSLLAGLVVTAALVLLSLPYRAAMGWLYNRTHSLLLVGVAHAVGDAMATGSVFGDALLPSLYGRNLGPLHLFAIGLLGSIVWMWTRGRLGHTT